MLVTVVGMAHASLEPTSAGRLSPVTRVRLDLGGGDLEFDGVLRAMHRAYRVLRKVQEKVLGPTEAPRVRWVLVGLRDGSAIAELEARPEGEVRAFLVEQVAEAYVQGIQRWAEDDRIAPPYFDDDTLAELHELAVELGRQGTGELVATYLDAPDQPRAVVQPLELAEEPDDVDRIPGGVTTVRGSVIGRIDAINLHERREATLYDDLDGARVVLSFGEPMVEQIRTALRRRAEAFGDIIEDKEERPERVRLHQLELLPPDDDLRPLADLVGLFPELTGEQDSTEWIQEQRREGGHG
jgi:hypothetical protein